MRSVFISGGLSALLALSGGALAQASGSDNVQVSLTLDVSRSISVAFDGDAVLSTTELISEAHEGYEPFSYNAYTGFATGCLGLSGVNDITVKVTGVNNSPDVPGNFLKGEGQAQDVYLYYYPILAIGPVGYPFAQMFSEARNYSPANLAWYYSNYVQGSPSHGHQNGAAQDLYGAADRLGEVPCEAGSPNIAFGAIVGIDGGADTALFQAGRSYGLVNQFFESEGALPDGSYTFSDTVTVEITPRL